MTARVSSLMKTSASGKRASAVAMAVAFSLSVARLSTMTRCCPLTLHRPPAPSSPPIASYEMRIAFFSATSSSSFSVSAILRAIERPRLARLRVGLKGQEDAEDRALPGRALDVDRAAMGLDDVLDDRQAEARSLAVLLGGEERLEDAR